MITRMWLCATPDDAGRGRGGQRPATSVGCASYVAHPSCLLRQMSHVAGTGTTARQLMVVAPGTVATDAAYRGPPCGHRGVHVCMVRFTMTGLAMAQSPALRGDNTEGLGRRYYEPPADDEDEDRDASHDNPDGQTNGLSPTCTFDHLSSPSLPTVYHLPIRYPHQAGPPSRRGDALCTPTGLDVAVCSGLRAHDADARAGAGRPRRLPRRRRGACPRCEGGDEQVGRVQAGRVATGTSVLWIAHALARIADRATNIRARRVHRQRGAPPVDRRVASRSHLVTGRPRPIDVAGAAEQPTATNRVTRALRHAGVATRGEACIRARFSRSSRDIPSAQLCAVPHTPYPSSLLSAASRKGRTRRTKRSGAS